MNKIISHLNNLRNLRNLKITQQGFLKLSKKFLIFTLISLILLTSLIFFLSPKSTSAAWFSDDWGYRQEVPVTSTNGSAQSNVYISFSLDTAALITAGKLQSSCQDIRITDQGGNLLPYHIGRTNACNASNTTIDFLLASFPDLKSNYYVYYGNPSVVTADTGSNFTQSEASNYSVGSLGTEAKGPTPTLYWKFDDAQGATAEDSSQNSLDGTISDTTNWRTEDMCVAGKCLYFDGTNNDNVTKSDDAKLDFAAADNFTVQAWVKRNGASSAVNYILTKAQSGYTGYKLYQDASGDYCFDVSDGTNTDSACTSAVDFDDDKWHLVTGVKAAATSITLYVDGNQRAQDASISATGTLANTGALYAGVDLDGTSNEWLGFIDEVKIYRDNSARTADQVKSDFNARGTREGASAVLGQAISNQPSALSNGLVGYWKTDESSGNAADSSGNSLTLTNNATVTYTAGKFANAGTFVAASSQYLSTATTISSVKTVSFWTNNASTTDEYINLTSGAYITSSSGTVSATGFSSPSIYVNGVLNGTLTASVWNHVVITTDTGIDANAFEVGRANSAYNNGKVDEVRTYNRALTSAEVSQLYNFAPGPVGYWMMDEGSWTNNCSTDSAFDSSGNGNNGDACPNTTGPTGGSVGKFGKAGSFDNSDDYLSVADNNSLDLTSDLTIQAWINIRSINLDISQIVAKEITTASSTGAYGFSVHETGKLNLTIFNVSDNLDTGASIPINTWTHVAVSRSGTNCKFYVNGALNSSITCSDNPTANTNTLLIGRRSFSCCYFDGQMDEVKIYNYSRTAGQVVQDMNAGHPAPGSPVGSPLGYWKINEGALNTCSGGSNDACNSGNGGNTYDGAFNADAAYTNAGKFGKALTLDGTGDYMSVSGFANDVFTSDWTQALWFKSSGVGNYVLTEKGTDNAAIQLLGGTIRAATTSTAGDYYDASGTYNDGNWHHVAVTFNSSSKALNIYVDGNNRKSATTTNNSASSATAYVLGGRSGGTLGLPGQIDEAKVYSSALTAQQILMDMNRGSGQVQGALSTSSTAGNDNASTRTAQSGASEYCIPGDSSTCTAPILRYDLEEGSGTTAYDTSTNSNTGTTTGAVYVPGKVGKGLDFDGFDDYIDVANESNFDFANTTFTVSGWFKADPSAAGYLFGKMEAANLGGWGISYNTQTANKISVVLKQSASGTNAYVRDTSNDYTDTNWHFLEIVITTSTTVTATNDAQIYIDGKLDNGTETETAAYGANTANLFIGKRTSGNPFPGLIDQVRIFNYGRTAAQVAWDYNQGDTVAYWKLDECQGTVANDASVNAAGTGSNGNTGTITIGASGTQTTAGTCSTPTDGTGAWYNGRTGKRNYSLNFDGTDDVVTVTETSFTDLGSTTDSYSVAGWFKTTANTATLHTIITKDDATGAWPYNLHLNVSERGCFNVSNVAGGFSEACGSTALNDGNWHHMVGVRDVPNDTLYLYVDGRLVNSANDQNSSSVANNDNITIGNGGASGTQYDFNGQIDDAKIFNYALTAKQVQTVMNEGAVRRGPVTGSP